MPTPYDVNGKTPLAAWIPSLDSAGNGTTTLTDLIGSNNGTLQNMDPATDWVADTNAGGVRALDFDHVLISNVPRVIVPGAATLGGNSKASLSMWALLQTPPPNANAALYFESTTTSGFTRFGVFQQANNQIAVVARDSQTGSSFVVTATPPAGWVHVVMNYDADTNRLEMFLNGVSAGANTATKGPLSSGTPERISVGAFTGAATNESSTNSRIDDVRTFASSILDSSDITYLYASGFGRGIRASVGSPAAALRFFHGF